jgi:hypothetical protein
MLKNIETGTFRIGRDLKVYSYNGEKWVISRRDFSSILSIVKLFKANKRFNKLIDKKEPKFLKGQLSLEGNVQGARINILPNGKKLDGAFSLFSPNLAIHDELSSQHWDVIYQNPNGKFAYHYTLDKKDRASKKKYKHVQEFEKAYPVLKKKVLDSLEDKGDFMALPLYTLLQTHMRVGNEIYYRAHGHKGLTTLKKGDVKIAGNTVRFRFLGKDGVPQDILKEFPGSYIGRMKLILKNSKKSDFIFKNSKGRLLVEKDFKKKFKEYIDGDFYPHIVRSYFATHETEVFLKKHKKPEKKEVKQFLTSVADELGHKKLSKKTGEWEDSYSVTVGHYIDPVLVGKLRKFL